MGGTALESKTERCVVGIRSLAMHMDVNRSATIVSRRGTGKVAISKSDMMSERE